MTTSSQVFVSTEIPVLAKSMPWTARAKRPLTRRICAAREATLRGERSSPSRKRTFADRSGDIRSRSSTVTRLISSADLACAAAYKVRATACAVCCSAISCGKGGSRRRSGARTSFRCTRKRCRAANWPLASRTVRFKRRLAPSGAVVMPKPGAATRSSSTLNSRESSGANIASLSGPPLAMTRTSLSTSQAETDAFSMKGSPTTKCL